MTTLLQVAFVLFALTGAGGALMTGLIAARRNFPAWLGTGHGAFALVCLCVLFAADLLGESGTPALAWWALGVFTAGFVGGMLLFRYLFRGRATLPLALMHGTVNVVGLILLYGAAF